MRIRKYGFWILALSSLMLLSFASNNRNYQTECVTIETVREHAMGFIQGVELLFSKELTPNKTTYVYFTKL